MPTGVYRSLDGSPSPLSPYMQFATIELRRREIDKHRLAQKKREHSQEEAEKEAVRKTVEGEKAWAETERYVRMDAQWLETCDS